MRTFGAIGVETVEVHLVGTLAAGGVAVAARTDIAISAYTESQGTVAYSAFEVVFPCPGIRGRVILPGICYTVGRGAVLHGTGRNVSLAIHGKAHSSLAPGNGHVGTLRPAVPAHVILPKVVQVILVRSVEAATQISIIADGEAGGISAVHTVIAGFLHPLPLSVFILVRTTAGNAHDGQQHYSYQ